MNITRKELHQQLWKQRITKVAEGIGIKEPTLRKICEEHEIPRPKAGYWTKLKYGKNPEPTKLEATGTKFIDLEKYKEAERSTVEYRVKALEKVLKAEFEKEFIVPKKLKNKHPLIYGLKSRLIRQGKSYNRGYDSPLHSYGGDRLYVTVSKDNMSRFLRIIETMITVLELRGHVIKPAHKKSQITVKGQTFDIRFIEKSNRIITSSHNGYDYTTLVPNGKLSIKTRIMFKDKEWKDGYTSLEEQLPKIVAFLEVGADDEITREIRWEKSRQEQKREHEIERQKEARIQWEEEKKNILFNDASRWAEISRLKSFLEEMKSRITSNPSIQNLEWVKWAENVLKEKDFLKNGTEDYIRTYDFKED